MIVYILSSFPILYVCYYYFYVTRQKTRIHVSKMVQRALDSRSEQLSIDDDTFPYWALRNNKLPILTGMSNEFHLMIIRFYLPGCFKPHPLLINGSFFFFLFLFYI